VSVAVFSADALLCRMLELEAKRCGLDNVLPEQARIWLIDLDHPVRLPKGAPTLRVAFASKSEEACANGADVLLPIPFPARELEELLCRTPNAKQRNLSKKGESLWLCGRRLHFSETEQALLDILMREHHRTVSAAELALTIGESAENSNAVAVYLYRLRRKLEADGITRIRTVRGVGYQWMGE
jgi:hypothetical protein